MDLNKRGTCDPRNIFLGATLDAATVGGETVVFEATGFVVKFGATDWVATIGDLCQAVCTNHHPSSNRHTAKIANKITRLFIIKVRH